MSRYPDKSRHPERSHWVDKKDKNLNILSLGRLCVYRMKDYTDNSQGNKEVLIESNDVNHAIKNHYIRYTIFSPSVSENGEVFKPETSCEKGTSLYVKNI